MIKYFSLSRMELPLLSSLKNLDVIKSRYKLADFKT